MSQSQHGGSNPPASIQPNLVVQEGEEFFVGYRDSDEVFPIELSDAMDGDYDFVTRTPNDWPLALNTNYMFSVCQDQETRTALFEWIERLIGQMLIVPLEKREYLRASNLIDLLAECHFSSMIQLRKKKRGAVAQP